MSNKDKKYPVEHSPVKKESFEKSDDSTKMNEIPKDFIEMLFARLDSFETKILSSVKTMEVRLDRFQDVINNNSDIVNDDQSDAETLKQNHNEKKSSTNNIKQRDKEFEESTLKEVKFNFGDDDDLNDDDLLKDFGESAFGFNTPNTKKTKQQSLSSDDNDSDFEDYIPETPSIHNKQNKTSKSSKRQAEYQKIIMTNAPPFNDKLKSFYIKDIIDIELKIYNYYNEHNIKIKVISVLSEDMKLDLINDYLDDWDIERFNNISCNKLRTLIQRQAMPKTPHDYVYFMRKSIKFHISDDFQPTVTNFRTLYMAILSFIRSFMLVHDYMDNVSSRVKPPMYQASKIPNVKIQDDTLISLFLSFLPCECGGYLHKMFIGTVKPPPQNMKEYTVLFKRGLKQYKLRTESLRQLISVFKGYRNVQVSDKTKKSANSLHNIEQLVDDNDYNYYDYLPPAADEELLYVNDNNNKPSFNNNNSNNNHHNNSNNHNNTHSKPDISIQKRICFEKLNTNQCTKPDCKLSHSAADLHSFREADTVRRSAIKYTDGPSKPVSTIRTEGYQRTNVHALAADNSPSPAEVDNKQFDFMNAL